jgi:hypothetical protein
MISQNIAYDTYIRMAMGSNVAFALRSILRKDLPKDFKVLDCSLS